MKKTITLMALAITINTAKSQTLVADFENFTLGTNSAYTNTNSVPFSTSNGNFQYQWTSGAFPYWSGGFSYTNNYDSITSGFGNLYGVRAYKGYNNSDKYIVGQDGGGIKLISPSLTGTNTVDGMYITNTTFAWKSMKSGDQFAKKFGGTTGNDKDSLVLRIKGYKAGVFQNKVDFFLANYTFTNNTQDYIVNTWQWVNTSTLGNVDSISFQMFSSDVGAFGINTPLFFAIDNFTTKVLYTGIANNAQTLEVNVYPNPFLNQLSIETPTKNTFVKITNCLGELIYKSLLENTSTTIDLSAFVNGIYFLEMSSENKIVTKKIIKN
jgi:hypothetical protein